MYTFLLTDQSFVTTPHLILSSIYQLCRRLTYIFECITSGYTKEKSTITDSAGNVEYGYQIFMCRSYSLALHEIRKASDVACSTKWLLINSVQIFVIGNCRLRVIWSNRGTEEWSPVCNLSIPWTTVDKVYIVSESFCITGLHVRERKQGLT